MQNQPTEQEEYNHSRPEDPFILSRPPLDHSNRITTDTQRVPYAIQFPLRPFQHLILTPQIAEDLPPALNKFV